MDSTGKNEDIIKLFLILEQELNILNFDKNSFNSSISKYQIINKSYYNFIEMKENNIIILGRGGSSYYIDLFNGGCEEHKITDKTYIGGIKINNEYAVLTSNKDISNGEDKLLFYNIKDKKISYEINDYSFTKGVNNLMLMAKVEKKSSFEILLCASKKYNEGQKNGILLVNPQLEGNKDIIDPFYETDNFEVYCFCQILIIENNNDIFDKNINEKYRKKIKITNTEYFLAGGFDSDKKEGKIKLFEIIYGNEAWNTKIEFIQDIEFEDDESFRYFDGAINCIIQSKISGNIIICCENGKVYLFTPPNIDYYLKNKDQ